MEINIDFTYEAITHLGRDDQVEDITYRYIAYPQDQVDSRIGHALNTLFSLLTEAQTKNEIESQIKRAFESLDIEIHDIAFDNNCKYRDDNDLIETDFCCIIRYAHY